MCCGACCVLLCVSKCCVSVCVYYGVNNCTSLLVKAHVLGNIMQSTQVSIFLQFCHITMTLCRINKYMCYVYEVKLLYFIASHLNCPSFNLTNNVIVDHL